MIAQASPAAGPLGADPSKRVNYTLGLVLGVDEFQQDQLYHAAARRSHDRLLHGYGTAWGLDVEYVAEGGREIRVRPGVAVDPCGREICVPDTMCVKLDDWLARHDEALDALFGTTPAEATLPLAVVLCYRECTTDTVPVPGEPCRSQEDAMAPSRIRAGFELKLALRETGVEASPPAGDPPGLTVFRPPHPEERAVRAFGRLLARVRTTTDEALGADGAEALWAGVEALAGLAGEDDAPASPPAAETEILLPAADAPAILREAMRLWVVKVRPDVRALEAPGVCGSGDGACCVLLAEVDLRLTEGRTVDDSGGDPEVSQERRPYLLHGRLLQEWLAAAGGQEGRPDVDSFASVEILGPKRLRVWLHHDGWLDLPKEAVTFVLNDVPLADGEVVEVPYGGIRNVWDVVIGREMADGDVVELRFDTARVRVVGDPPEGSPPGEVDPAWDPSQGEALHTLADELALPSGAYLDRYGAELSAFTVYDRLEGGDLEGEYKLPTVAKIQTFPVARTTPTRDQYLFSDGARWAPRHLPDGTHDLAGRYPASTVQALQGTRLTAKDPQPEQYLYFDGNAWVAAHLPEGTRDLAGRYPECLVTGLWGVPVAKVEPRAEQYLRYDGVSREWLPSDLPDATGTDLAGRYPELTVTGLRGHPIAPGDPDHGQVLVYSGGLRKGQWELQSLRFDRRASDLDGDWETARIASLQGQPLDAASPKEGQVLQFVESSPPGTGRWVPADAAGGGAPSGPAGGDLRGTYPDPQVRGLHGRRVNAPTPADRQILQFRESSPPGNGEWVAAAAPSGGGATGPAGGDLDGSYPEPHLAAVQGVPVRAKEPRPGDALVFDGEAWVPSQVSGSQPASDYAVVAAGRFFTDGRTDAVADLPSYNALEVRLADPQRMVFSLVGFPWDPERFQYVVKGSWEGGAVLLAPATREGPRIRLRILDDQIGDGELHVEVSAYPRTKQAEERIVRRDAVVDESVLRSLSAEPTATVEPAPKPAARTTRTPPTP